jgi:formimidoylglutamate deiminase
VNKTFQFDALYDGHKWIANASVELDRDGRVVQIAPPNILQSGEKISGFALPGFCNGHSHAFQFAMAGLTEGVPVGQDHDDFWSWRESMYALATQLELADIQVIAESAYSAMLRAGYTSVVEFNYLHHQVDGAPYAKAEDVSHALIESARRVGIDMVMVPILYQTSDIGQPANDRQKRFIHDEQGTYLRLVETLKKSWSGVPGVSIGMGAHSIRAVGEAAMSEVYATSKAWGMQFHIHIAEQQKEVQSALRAFKQRPIEWFIEKIGGDSSTYFVHATHCSEDEATAMLRSGINVVLCPSTEGDLGDGMFPLQSYTRRGGAWMIGSDSHVVIDPWYELRQLDYAERMRLEKRNVLVQVGQESGNVVLATLASAETKIRTDLSLGIEVGQRLDLIVVDSHHQAVAGVSSAQRLSSLLYAGGRDALIGWCKGNTFRSIEASAAQHQGRIKRLGELRQRLWS